MTGNVSQSNTGEIKNCHHCFKKDDDILLQTILYNLHPGTPMPNICHFSDATISILIKSITSIYLNIFPILFLS